MDDRPPEYVPSNHAFKGKISKRPSRRLLPIIVIIVAVIAVLAIVLSGILAPSASKTGPSDAKITVSTSSNIAAGEQLEITWTSSDRDEVGSLVSIYYSPLNQWPSTRTIIASTANDGYQVWSVPSTLSGSYVIYVTSSDGTVVGHGNVISIIASANPGPITPWTPSDPDTGPKDEPAVSLSWRSSPPSDHWNFGESTTMVVRNAVFGSADSSKIANVLLFHDLDAAEVSVTANAVSGPPLVVNVFDDGEGGSYGLLIDSTANIQGEKGWTWEYSSTRTTYEVSLNIIFYELGQHTFTIVAYDQDTGERVDSSELTTPAHIWGRGLADSGTSVGNWNGVYNPDATGVVRNYVLHDSMSTLAQSHYSGTLKDVVNFEGVSVRVWGVIDGVPTLWNPTSEGKYEFYWENFNGASSHEFRIQVQFLSTIPSGGTAVMHYGVFDNSYGENLLGYFGSGHTDIWTYLYP